jgi:GNAT superfamily N-acetyltransferase
VSRAYVLSPASTTETEFHSYYPGVVGKITEAHAVYYHENWGFDGTFETQVARELSEFIDSFQEGRDGLWAAKVGGEFAGSVVIDGREANTEGARLRWFIVVPPFQGTGLGKALLTRAVEFCRSRNYPRVYLWTFKGLDAARTLYEDEDFHLCREQVADPWGQTITEQLFELCLKR